MKKIILLMIIALLLVPLVSPAGWDNVLDYENKDLTVKITNWFGLLGWLGLEDEIGTAELKSHSSINEVKRVGAGNQVVMWYDFNFIELYENGLGDVKFTDMKTGKEIDRDYSFVYWGKKERNVYGDGKCVYSINGTKSCERVVVGKETYNDWLPYNSINIPKGNIRIGLMTYVEVDDEVDGVWTIAGKRVKKHAVWTSDLNVGLVAYYKLNEAAGTNVEDSVQGLNGTAFNISDADWILGKIGNALDFDGDAADESIVLDSLGQALNGVDAITISTWVNVSNFDSVRTIYAFGGTTSEIVLRFDSATVLKTVGQGPCVFGGWTDLDGGRTAVVNTWDHLVLIHNTTGAYLYINGAFSDSTSCDSTGVYDDSTGDPLIGTRTTYADHFDGVIDEFGVWNRSITGAEIVQLYNGGAGITHVEMPIDINIVFPLNITYNDTITQFNYTATESGGNGDRCWNSVDGGATNSTDVAFGTNFTITSDIGANTWIVYCNNTVSFIEQESVTFFVNMSVGTELIIPLNKSSFNISSVTFLINSSSINTDLTNVTLNIWYDNGTLFKTNFTSLSGSAEVQTNFSRVILRQGVYFWGAETCGVGVDCDVSENRTFEVHLTPSTVEILEPAGTIASFSVGDNLTLTWNITEPGENLTAHITNCSYTYNGNEVFLNLTFCTVLNTTSFLYVDGVNTLNFTALEEFNITTTETTTWSFAFLETGVSFVENVSETASETFEINLTTDINVLSISALLTYNGTNHTSTASCTSGNCTITNTIDVPLVLTGESLLYNFSWTLEIFNGTDSSSITTSTRQQNVTRIHLQECDATFTVQALNFTIYDEQTLTRITPFIFDGSFDFWLGSGTVMQNTSVNNIDSETAICLQPNKTFMVDAIIDYDEHSNFTNYTNRFYYLDNEEVTNASQDIFMYLLKSSASTSFILKVQDDSLLPVADAIIEIHRFYPGTGEFRIVQIARTDDNGKSIGFFETETVDYKFIIKQDGVVVLETGQQKVIPETSPFTLTFNLGEPLGEPWATQEELEEFESSLTWDDSSGIVTYIYIDSSGNFTLARLLVVKESLTNSSADVTICNENSTLTSATLTCTVGSTNGFYLTSTFISRNSIESLDKQFTFQIKTLSGVVGLLGLFFGWFLILVASFMFKFNEIAGVWAITVTVFLINLMGLISFGGVFVTAVIAIAIIMTWVLEK